MHLSIYIFSFGVIDTECCVFIVRSKFISNILKFDFLCKTFSYLLSHVPSWFLSNTKLFTQSDR